MKRKRNIRKKKNNLLLLILLVVGLSVGFAFVSSNISINGIAGINSSVFDIHWENVVPNSASTVTAETPGISEHATKVSFSVNLALPGDFYEFDVDAKNDGDWAGTITEILPSVQKVVEPGEDDTVPSYIKTSIVYKGTDIEPQLGDILYAGEKQTYTIRVEYDRDTDELPDEDFTIKVEEDITYSQWDTRGKYLIKFDPNGGSVVPSSKEVEEGGRLGSLPTPMKEGYAFIGWFTGATDGTKIDANTVPTGNVTYYAHWTSSFATFDTGENVNVKFKTLANPSATISSSIFSDTNVTAIRKSDTEPTSENKTSEHIVSIEGSTPIYAWFENGTIYWYTDADYVYLNQDSGSLFYNFTNATVIDTNFITSNVVNMSGLFSRTAATSLDLSDFDTGNVTNMVGMFGTTSVTSLDLSSFDTSKVTDMNTMFAGSKAISINLSSFDTKNVQNMSMMFSGSSVENLDLGGWNIENVSSIANMFAGSKLVNLDMSGWHYKKINALSGVFNGASFLRSVDMSDSNFESIQYFSYVFQGNGALQTVNLDNVDTSNITSLDSAFQGCSNLNNLDLSDFETSNLLYMSSTFQGCSSLTSLDLTSFDTLNVIYMSSTFQGCSNLTTITVSDTWTTANVQGSSNMFQGCVNLVGGRGTVYDSLHVDQEYAHYDYWVRNPGYFNKANLGTITITFDPNGGQVNPTTKIVEKYDEIGELPIPTNGNIAFGGWYTRENVKVTEGTVVTENTTYIARWLPDTTVTYNGNGGVFENSETTNTISYSYGSAPFTLYSHTSNIDDSGVASSEYDSNLSTTDVVTIPGSEQLNIEVWFSTESSSYDWLAIYPSGVTPNQNNYNDATISGGKLAGHGSYSGYTKPNDSDTTYHRTFTVDGDTAQFYFRSDSGGNYYGYYAIITGTGNNYTGDKTYQEPEKNNSSFIGWNTKEDGSGTSYSNEEEIINSFGKISDNLVLYAQWKEKYTITFNANGGEVDPISRTVYDGDSIGVLPVPTYMGFAFDGWYTGQTEGVKIDKDYRPNGSQTLWARWTEVEAKFDIGKNVAVKFKTLANPGVENITDTFADNNTIFIKRANAAPASGITTLDVSAEGSVPIYAWFDSGTIYWWSSANKEYLNEDASYMFCYFQSVISMDTTYDTSLTTNMYYMFGECSSLQKIDTSNFNTSSVTDMGFMFSYIDRISSLDLSNFDTHNVTNMYSMFYGMDYLVDLNLSNWDFTNYNVSYLVRQITGYDTNRLKRLTFDNAIFQQDMSFCFSDLTNVEYLSLKNVDTSKATTFYYLFSDVKKLSYLDLSDFDTQNVINMSYVFQECDNLMSINFSGWDTRNVTTLRSFCYGSDKLETLDLSGFDTRNVTDMHYLAGDNPSLKELNLSGFDFSKYNASSLLTDILSNSYSTLKIIKLDNTKYGTNMQRAFGGLQYVEILSLENADTSRANTMNSLFESDRAIKKLYLNSFDTKNVTDMSNMFYNMTNLKRISVSDDFVVGQVTSSGYMFYLSTELEGGNGTPYNSSFVNKAYAHYDYGKYNPGYFNYGDINRYVVNFDANGGHVSEQNRMVWEDNEIGVLPEPIWKDHEFDGWWTDRQAGIQINSEYIPNDDVTLVAKWHEIEKYNIVLDPNGGAVTPTSISVTDGNIIGALPIPIRKNYTFDGWYTAQIDGDEITASYIPTASTKLYAHWTENRKYKVTFNPNGGTVTETERWVYVNNKIGSLPKATLTEHTSAGWFTGLTDGFRISSDFVVTEDITVYAKWTGWVFENENDNPILADQEWSYYEDGERKEDGWFFLEDFYGSEQKYYFENGIAHIGWLQYNGDKYFLSDQDDDGNGYVNAGAYRSETKRIGGKDYTFDSEGRCTNCNSLEVCPENVSVITNDKTICLNNQNIKINSDTICRRALNLHQQKCTQTDTRYFCSHDGLQNTMLTYGNCGTSGTLTSGDAFTCDVNGDGLFDELTERFYYVSDYYNTSTKSFESDTAVLIYYNDVSNGIACDQHGYEYANLTDIEEADGLSSSTNYGDVHAPDSWHGPVTAKKQMPTISQWSNVSLKNTTRVILGEYMDNHDSATVAEHDGTIHNLPTNFSYEGYAARLLTGKEFMNGCNLTKIPGYVGQYDSYDDIPVKLSNCLYLFENTNYPIPRADYAAGPTPGVWLETPYSENSFSNSVYGKHVHAYYSALLHPSAQIAGNKESVRPVIEVPKNKIKY